MASRFSRYCRALMATLGLAVVAHAQVEPPESINRPFAARRVVFQFDFEPDAREVFSIPRYWDLAQDGAAICGPRPGFPVWNTAAFDDSAGYSGKRSLRLSTRGGSTSVRLEPGVIPVFPGTQYLISGRVRTRGLSQARACIVARYLDKSNKPIANAESRSELITTAPDEWRLAVCELSSDFLSAAFIQIDLEILQPQQHRPPDPDAHQLWTQDFDGEAWFDMVAVVQMPRATIEAPSPVNVLRAPAKPSISFSVRDLTGEPLTGQFILQNAAGRTVDTETRPVDGQRWEWQPKVSEYGWYRATVEIRAASRRVGATHTDFVWLPALSTETQALIDSPDASRFRIIVPTLPTDQVPKLAELVGSTGGGIVTIPLWDAELKESDVATRCQQMVPILENLRAAKLHVAFGLTRVPADLAIAAHIDPLDVFSLFALEEKVWSPYLVPFLDRFGQGVTQWHIGAIGSAAPPRRAVSLDRLYALMSGLVPGPTLQLSWPGEQSPPPPGAAHVEVLTTVPKGALGDGLQDLIAAWTSGSKETSFLIEPVEAPTSRYEVCADLVAKAIHLWCDSPAAPSLVLPQPWTWSDDSHRAPLPHATLAAFSNLSDRLRDRRPSGRINAGPGVVCMILEPGSAAAPSRKGALAIWRESPVSATRRDTLDVYLGENPVQLVDMFGNRTILEATRLSIAGQAADGGPTTPLVHRIPITSTPTFVEDVDVNLALFAASLKVEPAFLPSNSTEHEVTMVISNPWKTRIEGQVTVLEPGGLSLDPVRRDRSWRISPRTCSFAIGPGQLGRIPISVAFSAVEEAGLKDFLIQVQLSGAGNYAPIRMRTQIEVGVEGFGVELAYRVPPGSGDVSIEATVTNRSKSPSTLELHAVAPNLPKAKAFITDLAPGGIAIRRFSFPGSAAQLRGQRIVVGVQNPSTEERITRSIILE